jgi:hypothetical protein
MCPATRRANGPAELVASLGIVPEASADQQAQEARHPPAAHTTGCNPHASPRFAFAEAGLLLRRALLVFPDGFAHRRKKIRFAHACIVRLALYRSRDAEIAGLSPRQTASARGQSHSHAERSYSRRVRLTIWRLFSVVASLAGALPRRSKLIPPRDACTMAAGPAACATEVAPK